jgi:hypothetical protein
LLVGGLAGGTLVVSLVFGLAAGARLSRSVATGFYVAAAALLVGCFVVGARGPLRPDWGDKGRGGSLIPKGVRRADPAERTGAVRTSLLLFAIGVAFIVIGSLVDPDRRAF